MGAEMPRRYRADADPTGLDVPHPHPVPGTEGSGSPNGSFVFDVDVDGERFAVFEVSADHWNYEWLTGPKPYGFGASGAPAHGLDDHEERIRLFLRDIDPATGYLRED